MKYVLFFLLTLSAASANGQKMSATGRHNFETSKHLDIFNSLYRDLDLYYVDTLDAKKNIENALLYMLSQLDPYTTYYSNDNTEELKQMATGKYAGIGSLISFRNDLGRCIISDPYRDMPAAEAGLRLGDIILSIDGKEFAKTDKQEAADFSSPVSEALRGLPGTTLEVRVRRPGTDKPLTFKITRRTITIPSVTLSEMLTDSTGYIALNGFTENTARDVRLALVALKQQGARRLILDLRGNGGGLMGEAIQLVNLFIPRGREVVSTRGKVKESTATYKTQAEPLDLEMPVVVLTDFGTASAAEITAGALQDYDRAVVMGRRTYGKGLVQEPRELPYGTMLKLTTSKYYIPSGRCIQAYKFEDGRPVHRPDSLADEFTTAAGRIVYDGGGIAPDVEVALDSMPNLLLYLAASDELFDYAVRYRNTHDTIASPTDFSLTETEYAQFRAFLKEKNFTYDRQSARLLETLRKVAQREGYAEEAQAEFNALEAKLTHNEDFDFEHWKNEILKLAEQAIVAAYYYDEGAARYLLKTDKDVKAAVELLSSKENYGRILSSPRKRK